MSRSPGPYRPRASDYVLFGLVWALIIMWMVLGVADHVGLLRR